MKRIALLALLATGLVAGRASAQTEVSLSLTGQTAAIASTPLDSVRANRAGVYQINVSEILTTAGTAGTIATNVICNNGVLALTQTSPTITTTASLGTEVDAVFTCFMAAPQAMNYSTTFTSVTGSPAYSVRIRVTYLY